MPWSKTASLSKCRWLATNQKLFKTEKSFKNWTMFCQWNCHES